MPSDHPLDPDAPLTSAVPVRSRRHHTRLLGVALCTVLAGSAILVVPSATAAPKPTLKEVERSVSQLRAQAETATEDYNTTQEELKSIKIRLQASQAQMSSQAAAVARARLLLGQLASETYRRGQLSTLDLVLGDDPAAALAQAGYLPSMADRQAGAMNQLLLSQQELATTQLKMQGQERRATLAQAQLQKAKNTVDQELAQANAEVHQLKAAQQVTLHRDLTSGGGKIPSGGGSAFCRSAAASAPSSAARTAISFACDQLGDPYRWAGAGPSSWDCSGLTMKSYAAAGISLPHSSQLQANYGTRVSVGSLEPGDLVFFHSPIHHVGIYLGGGLMIHAPESGDVVRVASVYATPTAAVRF